MQDLLKSLIFLKKHYKYILLIVLIIFLGAVTYIYGKGNDVLEDTEIELNVPDIKQPVTEEFVIFDIKGAVTNPGAYKLNVGNRIYDAIRVSGGLTTDADTSLINLSKKLIDEMVIIVHTKDEVIDYFKKEPTIIYKDVPCICPDYKNDGCVTDESPSENDTKISINKASLEELMELPGIGEAKAISIIEYRTANDGFNSIEELLEIKGIGDAVFAKFKDFITL